jgi:hypothetical protein
VITPVQFNYLEVLDHQLKSVERDPRQHFMMQSYPLEIQHLLCWFAALSGHLFKVLDEGPHFSLAVLLFFIHWLLQSLFGQLFCRRFLVKRTDRPRLWYERHLWLLLNSLLIGLVYLAALMHHLELMVVIIVR